MAVTVEAVRNVVGGESVETRDGGTLPIVDPATGEVFAHSPLSSAEDVDAAYRAALDASTGWRDETPKDRSMALLRFADLLEAHGRELVERDHGRRVAAKPERGALERPHADALNSQAHEPGIRGAEHEAAVLIRPRLRLNRSRRVD